MPFEVPLLLQEHRNKSGYSPTYSGGSSNTISINNAALLRYIQDFFQLPQHINYTLKFDKIAYYNDSTGVYFTFHLPSSNDKLLSHSSNKNINTNNQNTSDYDLLIEPYSASACLLLSVSVGRPTPFILEALAELDKIGQYFNTTVYDCNENVVCAYDRNMLFKLWSEMNRTLCGIIQAHQYTKYWKLSARVMHECWRWNYSIKEREVTTGAPYPRIYYAPKKHNPNLSTFVVWKISRKMVLPTFVDTVIIAVDGFDHKTVVLFRVKMDQLLHVMRELKAYKNLLTHELPLALEITHNTAPEQLMRFVLKQKIITEKCQFVKEEQILEEEGEVGDEREIF